MGGFLLVPIHLDALCLETDLSVVGTKCDFTRLPYWDGEREVNPDIANISEELLSRPFQDRGLQLRAGVHLHWALPDALTKGANKPGNNAAAASKITFPAVPNRWLVTRNGKGADGKLRIERQWVVESDFLHPDAAGDVQAGVAIPFPSDPANRKYRPYRYLGRRRPFNAQWAEDPAAESLTKSGYQLTAVGYEPRPGGAAKIGGYGEPTFAAFYPNCLGVFGFHAPVPPATLMGTQYEVIGWYSDPALDCLLADPFLRAIEKIRKDMPAATDAAVKCEALKEAFKWQAPATEHFPDRIVCYARLDIAVAKAPDPVMPEKAVTVAVGNTGAEALSAYLAGGGALLEEQLEALNLGSRLDGKELDVGLKFREARHEKGFTAIPGGTLWSIRQESSALPSTDSGNAKDETAEETLPDEMAHKLNQLNLRQQARDHAARELESMQRQLFADWYKYMLCAYPPDDTRDDYPDVDEVRHFIEKNDLLPIKRQQARLKALDSQCERSRKELSDAVGDFRLRKRPAPRYWRPNEPALLIVDETVEPTKRHGQDGRFHPDELLECQILTVANTSVEKNFQAIRDEISKYQQGTNQERIGFDTWTEQPWNPFSLEWSVELFPRQEQNNLDQEKRDYDRNFITTNYQLEEGATDLTLRPGQEECEKAANVYSGASILTPHAKLQLQKQIEAFLERRPPPDPVGDELRKVSKKLNDPGFHAMAQTLNGFNDALLMRKQTLQLPIADPLGFDDARPFTEAVRIAAGNQTGSAPQPLDDFNPIRSGVLKILDLRLVDTFGRTQTLALKDERVIATEALSARRAPHLISLPPRLVQPARLNFRWLSADRGDAATPDEPEMNAHPATTPVCGWLILNNLDNSLMVYDNAGQPLGSINRRCEWESAPGVSQIKVERVEQIGNPHLKTLVTHLVNQGKVPSKKKDGQQTHYFDDFLSALENALENIDPENFAQHEALALLIGRPIAVVRATLDLELRSRPAINQDWNVFRLDLERDLQSEAVPGSGPVSRDTDGFAKVRFPIQLGDERQMNDGLVGYWKEVWLADGTCDYEDNCFYVHACDTARYNPDTRAIETALDALNKDLDALQISPEQKKELARLLQNSEGVIKRHSLLARFAKGDDLWQLLCDKRVIEELKRDPRIRYAADEPELFQAIDDSPQKLTMLVDPRGAAHATTGVLPTKTIRIPPDQYAKALRSLSVTFLSAPVMTTQGKINLPLPAEPGYAWSWLAKCGDKLASSEVDKWASSEIGQVNLKAAWSGQQEIREGWLRLTKATEE